MDNLFIISEITKLLIELEELQASYQLAHEEDSTLIIKKEIRIKIKEVQNEIDRLKNLNGKIGD